ncbi:benzoyl-CoA reductase [Candidatus Epulonipiscium fishelsonii]|uniref:Benzoyl-CoA reductase n=1 Tax=Candidatus Epulonipiscium fishelsonii TaxID=77094 RepID=A0ACC8XI09_9FIRM|nr:benzoyl-CoA reductase [Epulopiscium sp. SCG-D08WGA-EpuloA1]OON91128.1 MAG: benzoyl-CoA reductase [Epulopiscium sp. AS2M-Bin002]
MQQKLRERYTRNIQRVVGTTISNMDNTTDLSYYDTTYKNAFCNFEATDKKYIGTYCIMIPDEIIYALGYIPLRLCAGHQIPALIGEEIIPRDACPVVKATAGFHSMKILPMYNQCELAIMPMTCEAKRKSTEVLAKHLPIIPVPINMSKSNAAFEDTVLTIRGLVKTLEKQTNVKISKKRLKQACLDINGAQRQAYLLQEKLYSKNPQIKGSQVMYAINSFCYANPHEWESATSKLIQEIEEKEILAKEPKRTKPRVFIAGSPISFPNFKLPLLLEDLGAQIVGDESCLSGRLLYDPVIPNDYSLNSMIRALTARYISACTCPVFDNIEDRLYSLQNKMELSKAEGIIYHVLRGCIPYDFELAAVEEFAKKMDIPLLRVETDFSQEDIEQVKIRFEAFIEMIEFRRKNNG